MFSDWVYLKGGNVFSYYSRHSFGMGRLHEGDIEAESFPLAWAVAKDSEATPIWTWTE